MPSTYCTGKSIIKRLCELRTEKFKNMFLFFCMDEIREHMVKIPSCSMASMVSLGLFPASALRRPSSWLCQVTRRVIRANFSNLGFHSNMSGNGDSRKESLTEQAKRLAANRAVDDCLKDEMVIGIGSGSTVVYAVRRIAERVRAETLRIVCVPTSYQAKNLIIEHSLPLSDLNVNPTLDLVIDGCDEFDSEMNLIKGGGGCLLQEKIVASASKKLVIVTDYTKNSEYLGQNWKRGLPLEVAEMAHRHVILKLLNMVPHDPSDSRQTELRQALKKAGPVITDLGNVIVDFQIGELLAKDTLTSPAILDESLHKIPGILETGLFINMADAIYIGSKTGDVEVMKVLSTRALSV